MRRQHIWWDYNAVIQSAFRRGKNEGVASRLKAMNVMTTEQTAETIGLTAEGIITL